MAVRWKSRLRPGRKMNAELRGRLAQLPRLSLMGGTVNGSTCKICESPADLFDVIDFHKSAGGYPFGWAGIPVVWYRCRVCGLLFTDFFDDWTSDDFSAFIYNPDYKLLDPDYESIRPSRLVEYFKMVFEPARDLRILDFGSGTGVFVDALRQAGFDIQGYDPFSAPVRPKGKFDLITCFEVIEHSPNPKATLREMRSFLREGGGILISQTLQPSNIEELRCSWWYCAPRNGHCSTFTERSLAYAAGEANLRFHRGRTHVYAFTTCDEGCVSELVENIVGPPVVGARIGAPGSTNAVGWQHIENSPSGPFRWTTAPILTWRIKISQGERPLLRIPVLNVIREGFLQECGLFLDGSPLLVEVLRQELKAELEETQIARVITLELRTPPSQSPRELRGVADDRRLGLAIPVI